MKKKKYPPREVITIRLHPSTIKDLDSMIPKLRNLYNRPSRSTALRYVLSKGFTSMGNWRKEYEF